MKTASRKSDREITFTTVYDEKASGSTCVRLEGTEEYMSPIQSGEAKLVFGATRKEYKRML
jgi:hypothetical protein